MYRIDKIYSVGSPNKVFDDVIIYSDTGAGFLSSYEVLLVDLDTKEELKVPCNDERVRKLPIFGRFTLSKGLCVLCITSEDEYELAKAITFDGKEKHDKGVVGDSIKWSTDTYNFPLSQMTDYGFSLLSFNSCRGKNWYILGRTTDSYVTVMKFILKIFNGHIGCVLFSEDYDYLYLINNYNKNNSVVDLVRYRVNDKVTLSKLLLKYATPIREVD